MKKLTMTLLTALTLPATPLHVNAESLCDSVNSIATTVMVSRQVGIPAIELINAVKNINGARYGVLIIKDAFSRPKFSTAEYKESSVVEFANEWYMACINAGGDE